MGSGGVITPDTAVTLSISKFAALLGVKPALLKDILGTSLVELRDQPKIVAGGIDTESDMGFWTFFNKVGSIHTLNVPREQYIHHLHRVCLNGAVNAGAHSILIEPAANSIFLLYSMSSQNLDAGAVAHYGYLYTAGGTHIGRLFMSGALAANAMLTFPRSATGVDHMAAFSDPSLILTDAHEIQISTGSVAVAENTHFIFLYSYIGDAPTITETGPAGSAFTDIP